MYEKKLIKWNVRCAYAENENVYLRKKKATLHADYLDFYHSRSNWRGAMKKVSKSVSEKLHRIKSFTRGEARKGNHHKWSRGIFSKRPECILESRNTTRSKHIARERNILAWRWKEKIEWNCAELLNYLNYNDLICSSIG